MFRLGSALLLLVCAWLTAGEAVEVLALSPEEQAWVAAHPVVRIQMSDSSPPFEFRENGRWQGLAQRHEHKPATIGVTQVFC